MTAIGSLRRTLSSAEVFDEFDRTLHQEDAPWGNYGSEYAGELASRLSDADREALRLQWRVRPLPWQRHYAEVLDSADPASALPLLIEMLEAQDEALVVTAADSLRAFAPSLVAGSVTPAIRQRLQRIARTRGGVYRLPLKALLRSLDTNQPE